MNKKLLLIIGCLSIMAGPKVSIQLNEAQDYIMTAYEGPTNPAYKMSDQDYKLVVDLIFRNIDGDFFFIFFIGDVRMKERSN